MGCIKYFRIKYQLVKVIVIASVLLSADPSFAQEKILQDIRGKVFDKFTRLPVIGASVFLPGTSPLLGTATDTTGRFLLRGVPVGRLTLEISCIGYVSKKFNDIILTSAREFFITVEIESNALEINEVVITSGLDKNLPQNSMASVSARSFSIDETTRYAGSLGDPARMASNFAGVMAESPQRNDIIVRGNSPSGLLWRLDGIEIPNPNHFGTIGTTGGPVTILNNNLLTNSDFFISAFPAEYGNALAGVFDLKMRSGNPYQRNFWGQIGWNGFELGAEGGFNKNNRSSYLAAYRYTFLGIIGKLGFIGYVPQFQDLTIKFNVPTGRAGEFSIICMEGTSHINLLDSEKKPEDWTFTDEGQDLSLKTGLALIGVTHRFALNDKIYLFQGLSVQESQNNEKTDTFSIANPTPFPKDRYDSYLVKYTASSSAEFRPGKTGKFKTGIMADFYQVHFSDSSWQENAYRSGTLVDEFVPLLRGYGEMQNRLFSKLIINSGLYGQWMLMNNRYSVEPRLGLRWLINAGHALSAGYGLHSQMIPLPVYFFRTFYADGTYRLTNKNLGFSKSHHLVLSYDFTISSSIRLKVETYYQFLYRIPVQEGFNFPEYSLINYGESYGLHEVDSLENKGTGRNAGIEITAERFFTKGYYWLTTLSLFDSKYTGSDGIWRNTAFDSQFIINVLGGHEWTFHVNHTISVDIKALYAGGKRYVPVDINKSMQARRTIYDWDHAYENSYGNFFRLDFRVGYNLNLKYVSHRFAIDLQNITNHQNLLIQRVDPQTGEIINDYQIGFFPMITWKIEFMLKVKNNGNL
jgi:hypothetical protein